MPLVRKAVILDEIENAYVIYPVFGKMSGSPGKDLFLGFRVSGKKDKRGRLRVFPNRGTSDEPRYDDGFWLDERIPSARIPTG